MQRNHHFLLEAILIVPHHPLPSAKTRVEFLAQEDLEESCVGICSFNLACLIEEGNGGLAFRERGRADSTVLRV